MSSSTFRGDEWRRPSGIEQMFIRHGITSVTDPRPLTVHLTDGTTYVGRVTQPGLDQGGTRIVKLVDVVEQVDGGTRYGRIVDVDEVASVFFAPKPERALSAADIAAYEEMDRIDAALPC